MEMDSGWLSVENLLQETAKLVLPGDPMDGSAFGSVNNLTEGYNLNRYVVRSGVCACCGLEI